MIHLCMKVGDNSFFVMADDTKRLVKCNQFAEKKQRCTFTLMTQ